MAFFVLIYSISKLYKKTFLPLRFYKSKPWNLTLRKSRNPIVPEKRKQREVIVPNEKSRQYCTLKSFIHLIIKYFYCEEIEKDGLHEACSTHENVEEFLRDLIGMSKGKMSCGRLSLRWEIILKQILVTYNCLL
jgi:hypothetical protein